MTEKLYYRDAYATKFTARVLDCTEEKKHWTVILNRTLFYPEGGGQPADIGVLGGVRVLDVHRHQGVRRMAGSISLDLRSYDGSIPGM